MQLAWLSELIKKEVTSQGGAEEIRMILQRIKKKIQLKCFQRTLVIWADVRRI